MFPARKSPKAFFLGCDASFCSAAVDGSMRSIVMCPRPASTDASDSILSAVFRAVEKNRINRSVAESEPNRKTFSVSCIPDNAQADGHVLTVHAVDITQQVNYPRGTLPRHTMVGRVLCDLSEKNTDQIG